MARGTSGRKSAARKGGARKSTATRRAPRMTATEKECARLDALAVKLRADADEAASSIDRLRAHADAAESAALVLREGTS